MTWGPRYGPSLAPRSRGASRLWRGAPRVGGLGAMSGPHVNLDRERHPAVEVDGGAGDVAGALGGEEGHEVGELAGVGHAADGNSLCQLAVVPLHVAVLGAAGDLGALDQADADRVHEDAVGGVLVGERLRQIDAGRP